MKKLTEIIQKEVVEKKKKPLHEKAASVNEIIKVVGKHKKYSYTYWLRMVGKRSYPDVMGILKEMENLPSKYNKGGVLTNRLRCKNKNTK